MIPNIQNHKYLLIIFSLVILAIPIALHFHSENSNVTVLRKAIFLEQNLKKLDSVEPASKLEYATKFSPYLYREPIDFGHRMKLRRKKLIDTCQKLHSISLIERTGQVYNISQHSLLEIIKKSPFKTSQFRNWRTLKNANICLPPKHGTTSWQSLMQKGRYHNSTFDPKQWEDFVIDPPEIDRLKKLEIQRAKTKDFKYWILPRLQNYKTATKIIPEINNPEKLNIVVARHPVDKLYSAWSDKFRNTNDARYIKRVRSFIDQSSQDQTLVEFQKYKEYKPKTHKIAFADFIQYYIGHNYPELIPAVLKFHQNQTTNIEYPTRLYPVYANHNDWHWMSFSYQCLICNVNITYISKTETSSYDSLGIFDAVYPKFPTAERRKLNIRPKYVYHTGNEKMMAQEEVKTNVTYRFLPDVYKLALNFIFQFEYEMFGYQPIPV